MAETVIHRFFNQAKVRPDAPAYYVKTAGAYKPTSWKGYVDEVRAAAKSLIALGIEPGGTAAILGFNRPEWVIMDLAVMAIGGAAAGIYVTCSAPEIRYIVDHAEARVLLIETREHWEKIRAEWERMPKLAHVVVMKGGPLVDDPRVLSWEAFLAKGEAFADARVDERVEALEPQGLALLIYTSGTTGPPKAVMLSHENLAWTSYRGASMNFAVASDTTLSYLPLAHIAEQVFTLLAPVTVGSSVYFAESVEKVSDNLKEVQPTIFLGVPRVWEKMHAGISAKLEQAKGTKRALLDFARRAATERSQAICKGTKPSLGLRLRYAIAQRLIFSKLKPAVGLGNARVCVTGAAPLAREVFEFFASLDVIVQEVYGMSEGAPTTYNELGKIKFGTVGTVCEGAEVEIAKDGEILARGPHIFLGYYKDEAATKEALVNGWLYSGDLGTFDDEGFLSITGRKKEILITAGGKNISPKNIEEALKAHPLVAEAIAIGDRRKFLSALLVLDPDAASLFAKERGITSPDLHRDPALLAELQKAVDEVNQHLSRVETVKKFTVLPRPLSLEMGELTPTLKVKRRIVNENFAPQIEAMYQE